VSDYDPKSLARKWTLSLDDLRLETEQHWVSGRPKRPWLPLGLPEADLSKDQGTPRPDLLKLAYHGRVVLAHFARAFFPAYIPGVNTHYGSVVYCTDPHASSGLFDLAWRVNELRRDSLPPPPGTERVAFAIRDDQSDFARIEMPLALGVASGCFFANICILRSRLPLGYLHSRLVPILICPEETQWCCLLPLRFWSSRFSEIWASGDPAYPVAAFLPQCRQLNITP
jgi:hypothetical protein